MSTISNKEKDGEIFRLIMLDKYKNKQQHSFQAFELSVQMIHSGEFTYLW